jgi:hypothetical protein
MTAKPNVIQAMPQISENMENVRAVKHRLEKSASFRSRYFLFHRKEITAQLLLKELFRIKDGFPNCVH